jgi:hypothetical protein
MTGAAALVVTQKLSWDATVAVSMFRDGTRHAF